MKCYLGISNFLEEISSFSHSGFSSNSLHCSLKKSLLSPCFSLKLCIQLDMSFHFSFAFHFFSQLFVRPPQTTILPFCISFASGWFWSPPPVQCYGPLSIALQALCLPVLISWICSSPPLNGNPLQYSCLENPMDGGAWWATVHGFAESRTQLSDFTSSLLLYIHKRFDLGHSWMA